MPTEGLQPAGAIYNEIRGMITDLRFRPGEKINEVELSLALDVSRTPIREALNRLVSEDLVTVRKNYGFYCRNLSKEDVLSLIDASAYLWRDMARLAQNAGPNQIRAVTEDARATAGSVDGMSSRALAGADEQNRNALSALSGNAPLASFHRNLNARLRFLRKLIFDVLPDPRAVFLGYAAISENLEAGQINTAQQRIDALLAEERRRAPQALERAIGLSSEQKDVILKA